MSVKIEKIKSYKKEDEIKIENDDFDQILEIQHTNFQITPIEAPTLETKPVPVIEANEQELARKIKELKSIIDIKKKKF